MNNSTKKADLFKIDPRNIVIEEGFNCRVDYALDDLIESIRENGVKEPVTVFRIKDENGDEKYRLVNGHRRYYATMKLIEDGVEIARIPAMVIPKCSDADLLVEQIVRNGGKPFNEYELGIACKKFLSYGFTKSEIAKKLGKNPGVIAYCLDHFNRDERVQEIIKQNKISGPEVRRIYAAHKNDEEGAIEEIMSGIKIANEKGKTKVTCKDLSLDGKTKTANSSKAIKNGLEKLMFYYEKYSNVCNEIAIDVEDILNKLKDGQMIDTIFENYINEYRKAE